MAKRTTSRNTTHKYTDFVDDIDIDLVEEAIGFDVLRERGNEDIGQCPDFWGLHKHGDQTGKFAINRESKVWNCWVCDGGNLVSLAMGFLDADEDEATEWLYGFATGDTRNKAEFVTDFMRILDDFKERQKERMPYFNKHVLHQFSDEEDENGWHMLSDWCEERHIERDIAGEYHLGFASMYKRPAPLKNGKKIDDDYYGPCLTFPHFWQGRLVGWQYRWMNYGEDTPKWLGKYTNTSDFPKQTTLYNYDKAVKSSSSVFVVESVPTVLFLASEGVNAVSPFGAAIRPEQLRLLRHFDHVVLCPDNDKPGREFVEKAVPGLQCYCHVEIVTPVGKRNSGEDLGDLGKRDQQAVARWIDGNRCAPDKYPWDDG